MSVNSIYAQDQAIAVGRNKPLAYAEAGDPDLAYGTSAHYSRFSLRDIGTVVIKDLAEGHWKHCFLFHCTQGPQ